MNDKNTTLNYQAILLLGLSYKIYWTPFYVSFLHPTPSKLYFKLQLWFIYLETYFLIYRCYGSKKILDQC